MGTPFFVSGALAGTVFFPAAWTGAAAMKKAKKETARKDKTGEKHFESFMGFPCGFG
jgi:hypothetical protein